MIDENVEDRVAEWMITHGYNDESKGHDAARALLFFLDRHGYVVVPCDQQ